MRDRSSVSVSHSRCQCQMWVRPRKDEGGTKMIDYVCFRKFQNFCFMNFGSFSEHFSRRQKYQQTGFGITLEKLRGSFSAS